MAIHLLNLQEHNEANHPPQGNAYGSGPHHTLDASTLVGTYRAGDVKSPTTQHTLGRKQGTDVSVGIWARHPELDWGGLKQGITGIRRSF